MNILNNLRHPDRLFALVLIAASGVMYALTGTMEEPTAPGAISASTFPLMTLLGITLICCFIILRPVQDEKSISSWNGLSVIMLTAVYIALIEPLGFFVITPIFLLAQPVLGNFRRFTMLGISVVLITIAVYALFTHVLEIPLPAGILGD